jgi:hypothetical protein
VWLQVVQHHPWFWDRGQGRGSWRLDGAAKDLRNLDESVLGGKAEGEWRWTYFGVLENTEHAVGSLSQVVVGVNFGKREGVGKPVDGENMPALRSGWNVAFMAAVVVEGWTHVPAVNTMGSHVGSLRWSDVGDNSGAQQGEGCVQEIEGRVEAGVGSSLSTVFG